MYNDEDCPHFMCGDCKYFKVDADRSESLCKRIDHKTVKFWRPYFASYDCGQHHMICADFEPKHPEYADFKDKWEGFEDYWAAYKEAWLPSGTSTVPFYINDDHSAMYRVPLETFLYGPVVKDGVLQAISKTTSGKAKQSNGVQLYGLHREPIDGVRVDVK